MVWAEEGPGGGGSSSGNSLEAGEPWTRGDHLGRARGAKVCASVVETGPHCSWLCRAVQRLFFHNTVSGAQNPEPGRLPAV